MTVRDAVGRHEPLLVRAVLVAAVMVVIGGVVGVAQSPESSDGSTDHAATTEPGSAGSAASLGDSDPMPVAVAAGGAAPAASGSPAAVIGSGVGAPPVEGGSPGSEPTRSVGGRLPVGPGTHGVTDTSIQIGIITVDTNAFNATAAAATGNPTNMTPSDYDANKVNKAIIDHVNAGGGLGGRTIEPVIYKINIQNYVTASGRQQESQSACAHWTEDNDVFAMEGLQDQLIVNCAQETKTVLISGWLTNARISERRFAEMSEYSYTPSGFTTDRQGRAMARFFLDNGFFSADAKVALLTEDKPESRAGADLGMKPVLAQAGIDPLEIYYPDAIESSWDNYVLQMQSAEVTHVIFSPNSGGFFPSLFTMRAAENQRFRPAWGMSSTESPNGMITTGNMPAEQMQRVMAMGWVPISDIGDSTPQGPNGQECAKVIAAVGQPSNGGECDLMFFLRDSFSRASELSPRGLAAGAAKLGASTSSGTSIDGLTRFSDVLHDGVTGVRKVVYDADAHRMRYVGDLQSPSS